MPVLWRGMRDMKTTDEFMQKGGTEMAFMSTTSQMSVAVRYSLRCFYPYKDAARYVADCTPLHHSVTL